ncbi:MAG: hypothetical protein U9O41_00195 [Candidatus Aerophobetes bacterium]|nr:hypothetical protein [Candidatus Aerophobetes bacterium]
MAYHVAKETANSPRSKEKITDSEENSFRCIRCSDLKISILILIEAGNFSGYEGII